VPSPSAWLWSFGDGQTSTEPHPLHVYATEGVYDVRLRVTGSAGASVKQRNAFIRVGEFPSIGIIGGSLPPSASDAAAANYLRGFGFEVLQRSPRRQWVETSAIWPCR
jgi:PKD repeat protein